MAKPRQPAPPKPRGLAALLPDSVLRGATSAVKANRAPPPDEDDRKKLREAAGRGAKAKPPKALPAPRPSVGVCATAAGVLVDERGRMPDLRRLPDGGCVLLVDLPSGRLGGVSGVWGRAPAGMRWAALAELQPEDRADALAVAPGLADLAALGEAEEAARALLVAAGVPEEDLAGLRAADLLRAAAARLRDS